MESQPKTNAFLVEFILTASSTCSFAIAFSFNLWQQTTAGTQSNLQDVRTRRRSGSRSCCWSCTILISYAPLKARTIKIPKWTPRQRITWRLTFMSSLLPTTVMGIFAHHSLWSSRRCLIQIMVDLLPHVRYSSKISKADICCSTTQDQVRLVKHFSNFQYCVIR